MLLAEELILATQTDPERIASLETAIQYLAGGQARMDARLDRIEAKVDRLAIIMIAGLFGLLAAMIGGFWLVSALKKRGKVRMGVMTP